MLDDSSMMFPETAHFSGRVVHLKNARKKKLSIGTQTLLLESFARSAARDAKKLYDLEIKKLPKEKETTHGKNR